MSGYNYPLGSGAETWEDVRAALNLGPSLCLACGPGPAWWGPASLSPAPEECHLGHRVSWLRVTSVLYSQPLSLAHKGTDPFAHTLPTPGSLCRGLKLSGLSHSLIFPLLLSVHQTVCSSLDKQRRQKGKQKQKQRMRERR